MRGLVLDRSARALLLVTVITTLALLRARGGRDSPRPKPTDADRAAHALVAWSASGSSPPASPSKPDPGRRRSVPCIDSGPVALAVVDHDPVVCSSTLCRRIDDGDDPEIPRPPAGAPLPLDLVARATTRGWSVCDGGVCTALGRRVTAAIARAPSLPVVATLDRQVVVVGRQAFAVASDRPIRLPAALRADHDELELSIAGNMILDRSLGSCTDSECELSQLVDRNGSSLDWVKADGRVLRVGDTYLVLISELSDIDVRDARTGARRIALSRHLGEGDLRDAIALDDHTFALMRDTGDGVTIERIELADTDLIVRFAAYLPSCE